MTERPKRPTVRDELGRPQSLPAGPGDFQALCGHGPEVLLLGLGPEPEALPALFPEARALRYLECPAMAAQLGEGWRGRIPAGYAEASPEELPALLAAGARVVLYAPGTRLFPLFWEPLLAKIQLALLRHAPAPRPRLAWLPGGQADLLRTELREAFESLGWSVRTATDAGAPLDAAALPALLAALLAAGECPELYFSVNFCGLDPLGKAQHLLAAAGVRTAVWCVDNPLHLLSGCKSRSWTELPLFVTDDWFLEPLRQLGARSVHHLPLAARAADLDRPAQQGLPELKNSLVFVGRSAFPGKEGFFAGCRLPQEPWAQAQAMLQRGERPHFGWWLEQLGVQPLWPGTEVRRAGYCAEETGRAWRTLCLSQAAHALGGGLTIHGDEGWPALLPKGTDVRPPVDYYAALPAIAASAACCLNLTSPLLPRGLTQRHFDTWAWGGTLLSDATPGLDIFPAELTRELTFQEPVALARRFRALADDAALRRQLGEAWRGLLRREHTYAHRLARVLEI